MKKLKLKIKNSNSQSGISLIEVIITMFMIGVLLVLYSSALNVVAMTKKLRYENIAYHIASKQMEIMRNTIYDDLPASGTITDPLLSELPTGAGAYTTTNYAGYSGMKEIVVTVTWNDSVAKDVTLRTLAGTGGINP